MKHLKLVTTDVVPALPDANTLYVVNGKLLFYDNNSILVEDTEVVVRTSQLINDGDGATGSFITTNDLTLDLADYLTSAEFNDRFTTTKIITELKKATTSQIDELKTLLNIV